MKIAIIGGGFIGLTAALRLASKGHNIYIFEKDKKFGGLASTFNDKNWKWCLEKYYHHVFKTDRFFLKLSKELNVKCEFKFAKTSIFYKNNQYTFDSPIDLIMFSPIPFIDRIRTGITIIFLKLIINWKPLEKIRAIKLLRKLSGDKSWRVIWSPLFYSKFGASAPQISAAWFWARIKKRGNLFGYPLGGFEKIIEKIILKSKKNNAKFFSNSEIVKIKLINNKFEIRTKKNAYSEFDKIICTTSTKIFVKIFSNLPKDYINKIRKLKGRATINLVLKLKNKFFEDDTYWLNINEKSFPFVGVVEHTNFINKRYYNKENIIYIANYLDLKNPMYRLDKSKLIKKFSPYFKKINPKFNRNWILKSWIFKSDFAQPIIKVNYSKDIPPQITPLKNVFLVNIQQVYPWDRQVNYAIELGEKISNIVLKSS